MYVYVCMYVYVYDICKIPLLLVPCASPCGKIISSRELMKRDGVRIKRRFMDATHWDKSTSYGDTSPTPRCW